MRPTAAWAFPNRASLLMELAHWGRAPKQASWSRSKTFSISRRTRASRGRSAWQRPPPCPPVAPVPPVLLCHRTGLSGSVCGGYLREMEGEMLNIWCTTLYRSIGEYMSVFYHNFWIWYNQDSFLNNWFQGVLERIARFTLFTCWHQSYSLGTKRKKTDWNREGLPELVFYCKKFCYVVQ
jgi:hypothetical protein